MSIATDSVDKKINALKAKKKQIVADERFGLKKVLKRKAFLVGNSILKNDPDLAEKILAGLGTQDQTLVKKPRPGETQILQGEWQDQDSGNDWDVVDFR